MQDSTTIESFAVAITSRAMWLSFFAALGVCVTCLFAYNANERAKDAEQALQVYYLRATKLEAYLEAHGVPVDTIAGNRLPTPEEAKQ